MSLLEKPGISIREGRLGDLETLYAITLATGDSGSDASRFYADKKMMGHIYSAPYLLMAGGFCFVAEDQYGVCGYVVGTLDTLSFAGELEEHWWPDLRRRYAEPDRERRDRWTADERRAFMFHHPELPPDPVLKHFPAHLHMNLLTRARGHGLGQQLLEKALCHLSEQGGLHVHVGAGKTNRGGLAFWKACGFASLSCALALPDGGRTEWLGRPVSVC